MPQLSVIIITKNAAADIDRCLASVAWADELIVLDSGSTDDTVARCQKYTSQVFSTDWPGFGAQKNRALAKATGDWVLSLDADEYVSDALRDEIKTALQSSVYSAYFLPRKSSFCGQFIHYGSWRSDRVLRLFKRECGQFSNDLVHETLIAQGNIGNLSTSLLHYTYKTLDDALEKMNRYSTLSAQQHFNHGAKKANLLTALIHGFWSFFNGYILRAGFLDGSAGFILAVMNAEGSYYRYLKLRSLQKQNEER